ncbi:MAG: phytoene desaturase family protein [Verrucomicrobiales bacterium]
MSESYDVIVVGAGHNGLIAANYLVDAGLKVLILERRDVVGGAVCTEERVPGFRFDVGSSAHIMFKMTPIMKELRLDQYGLEYIEMDPWAFHPVEGVPGGLVFWRSVEKTCDSIARISPRDAQAYADFVKHWGELNEGVFETFLKPPTPANLFGSIFKRNLTSFRSRKLWSSLETVRQLMSSYGRVIEETFESEPLRAALSWLAAQSGPPPSEIATGDFVGWYAMIHRHGAWRAKGGSGALTQALAARFREKGGRIVLDASVKRINPAGGVRERFKVETLQGQFTGASIMSACHIQTLFKALHPDIAPDYLRQRIEHLKVGNGFGMVVRHAVSELPQYLGQPRDERGVSPAHSALQLLCPSRAYLDYAYKEYSIGRPPTYPAVVAMTFSAIDPSLAPPGQHTLFAWAQYHPYELATGESWDGIAEREADKIWQVVCNHAPNMKNAMIDRYIQTPVEIERLLGLPHANVMHLEMSFDQMFAFRPTSELSGYRTPIPGLYLTGASTHPGGGVFGASGRSAAKVLLQDLKKKKLKLEDPVVPAS